MTYREIVIALAELDGWRPETREEYCGVNDVKGFGRNQHLSLEDKDRQFCPEVAASFYAASFYWPDYINDLNIIHRFEHALTARQYRAFCYHLKTIRNEEDVAICKCVSAPAKQRCEAILKALEKWKES